MPGAQWFPGATLNYAEHALTPGPGRADDDVAVVFAREDGCRAHASPTASCATRSGRARAGLVALGRGPRRPGGRAGPELRRDPGRRSWPRRQPRARSGRPARRTSAPAPCTTGSPRSSRGAARRRRLRLRRQAVRHPRRTVAALREQLPTLRATVLVAYLDAGRDARRHRPVGGVHRRRAAPAGVRAGAVRPPAVGALLVGHDRPAEGHRARARRDRRSSTSRRCALQQDLGPGERFFWFTTTGWMMWNFLIGGLLVGATVVLFDGNPGHPDLGALWRLAERHRVTVLRHVGAVHPVVPQGRACAPGDELRPVRACARSAPPARRCRRRASAGSPTRSATHVQICSVSGGTDVCAAFVGVGAERAGVAGRAVLRGARRRRASPTTSRARSCVDEVGELVITQPMPSMPVMFWNDPDGTRLREAYFEDLPGRVAARRLGPRHPARLRS